MSTIRKQTILSILITLLGFGVGAMNMYLFMTAKHFTNEQFGLTKIFYDFAVLLTGICGLGFLSVIQKFYPYYSDNLSPQKNDLPAIGFVVMLLGFAVFCLVGYFIKPYFISNYIKRSKLVVDYYPYLFVFGLGSLLFSLVEVFCWAYKRSVFTNFLKESLFRLLTLILIILYIYQQISFNSFIMLFTAQFLIIFFIAFAYLKTKEPFHLTFSISRVTKKFYKKMLTMQAYLYSGVVIITLAGVVDSLIIAKLLGLGVVAVFTVAQYGATLINVPQRSIATAAIGHIAQAWKDKNQTEIFRIYQRSCINLSILAIFIFGNVWLNIIPLFDFLQVKPEYYAGITTLFFIGIARVIDASTGLNNFIVGMSNFWRFEFFTGMILLVLRMSLAWLMIAKFGLIGSAYSDIISISIYNFIRFEFLRRKFGMQPFTYKNVLAIVFGVAAYYIAFYAGSSVVGLIGIMVRAVVFCSLYLGGVFLCKLTPDVQQLYDRWVKKIR